MRMAEKLASSIGKGLVAGLAGTASMTVSSTIEARLRQRKPSSAPARATTKVLGISSFADEIAQARFNDLAHWGYGTVWGVMRGLLDALGLPPRAATAVHGPPSGEARRWPCPPWRSPRPLSSGHGGRSRLTPSTTRSMRSPRASPMNC
jgi:hypothetical protein